MKYLAHIENNLESKIISIYDVIKGLNGENPLDWEGRTYFSLWYNKPMIAKVKSTNQKPHFAFKDGFGDNKNSGGGESIEHQLSKKIIFDLKTLQIKIGDIEGILEFSKIFIEKPFENGKYKADLYCKIGNVNNFNFPVDSMIIIELHSTNKVKKSKEKFYRDNNIAAIEINIWEEIKFGGDIEQLQRQLVGYFKKQRFAKRLHDPNWKAIVHEKQNEINKQIEEAKIKKLLRLKEELERTRIAELELKKADVGKSPEINFKTADVHIEPARIERKSFWRRIFELIVK